jgi:transcriptional regulator with PAS, ATPase and Fis domain
MNFERIKRMAVIHAYRLNRYNKSRAAKALGVARASVVSWVKLWNLDEVKK